MSFAFLMGSLTFWCVCADDFGSHMVNGMISFATYPDDIFQDRVRFLLYLVIPIGMAVYQPVHVMMRFDFGVLLVVLGYAVFLAAAAVFVFYRSCDGIPPAA